MKIINKINHPLLKREQLTIEVEHTGDKNPKKNDLLGQISERAKADQKFVNIKFIDTDFGNTRSVITANVYNDEKAMKSIEELRKKKRKGAENAKDERQK